MSRYYRKETVLNNLEPYSNLFEARDKNFIIHHRQTTNLNIRQEFLDSLRFNKEIWSIETKLYKLSFKYYNTVDLWWVIGAINSKPTDAHWKVGDPVYIPIDPEIIIKEFKNQV